jgi:hypothetical protein
MTLCVRQLMGAVHLGYVGVDGQLCTRQFVRYTVQYM